MGRGKHDVGEADDLEIADALRDDQRLVGQKAQQLARCKPHDQKHQNRHPAAKTQGGANDMGDRLQLVFSPVLGAQHNSALAGALHQHLKHELHLVAQADSAHGVLAVPPQHDRVHHIDTVYEQILQGQRQCQHKKGLVELFFPYHEAVNSLFSP